MTGVVDSGAMDVESVSADLARLLGTWSLFVSVDRTDSSAKWSESVLREVRVAPSPSSAASRHLLPEGEGGLFPSRAGVGIAAYQSIRALDDSEVEAIGIFERLNGVLVGARWMRWHFVDRIAFFDPSAVMAGLSRSVERLAERTVL